MKVDVKLLPSSYTKADKSGWSLHLQPIMCMCDARVGRALDKRREKSTGTIVTETRASQGFLLESAIRCVCGSAATHSSNRGYGFMVWGKKQ